MASSSSSTLPTCKYNVFTSFHGPDVRQKFLSHLRKQFDDYGITMFDDQGIERSQMITPALTQAIKESWISIVLLSKNYASSSWCLDELLEILECKKNMGQIVMTVFYGVDPSDVRHQTGDFGMAFNKTCDRKTDEERIKWSQALTYVGNIAGEHFQNWHNEAEKIEKIASDVSIKLNATPSRDFGDMVGLDDHLREMKSLLDFEYNGVKMIGISGPVGIGKSTIARALHSQLANSFQHTCFMDNIRGSYNSGLDKYGLQLYLQEQLLSKVLNLKGIRICHLGVIKDRLQYQKVLIILDDVESLDQLEALADISWFGPGSRIIVTTENKEILHQHDINDIYQVHLPSEREALQIFCLSAFKQTSPPHEFMNLTDEVVRICGNLPLGLHVLGSSLRGKSKADWIDELPRLKDCLNGKIESVLKVGYESLYEKDQTLFLLIAVFFNYKHVDYVTSMLTKSNFDVRPGLKVIANRNLIHIDSEKRVVMHRLLQVMARQVISKQEPWKRQILVDSHEICDVLESATGNRSIIGVSFDVAEIDELTINTKAFERMRNLSFLKVYDGKHIVKRELHIPEEMEFPRRIRLFHWNAYPGKSLHRFYPENLVELNMENNQLEKLWEGRQLLTNLKKMDLSMSSRLKELPDITNATNLERLDVSECTALVELPSSIVNLHKISSLQIWDCKSLEVIPTLANLTSLTWINMRGCSQLRSFPNISTNITSLSVSDTGVEEFPTSLRHCTRLRIVEITGNLNLKTFLTHLPTSVTSLDLSDCGIERITDCIKSLDNLQELSLRRCKRLVSLPELPCKLWVLRACDCDSLERVSGLLNTNAVLDFTNCLKLDGQAQQTIIQQSFVCGWGWALLPGSKVPKEFDYRAKGNFLTFPHSCFNMFKVCIVILYKRDHIDDDSYAELRTSALLFRCKVKGKSVKYSSWMAFSTGTENMFLLHRTKHLVLFHSKLPFIDHSEVSRKIVLEFRSRDQNFDIIECGIQILTDHIDESNNGGSRDEYTREYKADYTPEYESESDEASDEEKVSNDSIANETSESEFDETSDTEDDEEGYKS